MSHTSFTKRAFQYLLTGTIAIVVSLTWEVTWRLSQVMHNAKYFVLSVQYLSAAFLVFALMVAVDKRVPRMSIKMFHASISIGFLFYFMPGLTTFYSMSFMSPGVSALAASLVPLWLWVYGLGNWRKKVPGLAIGTIGVVLFFYGSSPEGGISAREWAVLFVLLCSSFLVATAVAFVRKIFWMHYGLELNFWAMLFASGLLALTSFLFAENRSVPPDYQFRFMLFVGVLAFLVHGLGTFFYRYVASQPRFISTMTLTIGVPLLGVMWSWLLGASTIGINIPMILGLVTVLSVLILVGTGEPSGSWMTHFLTNTRRIGERVVCHIKSFVKTEKGAVVQLEVTDLSIGGMGYYSDEQVHVGQNVLVTVPLGSGWTQLSVEARIVHAVRVFNPAQPTVARWHGGLMFINMPEERLQPFVEFIASVGRTNEQSGSNASQQAAS